MTTWRVRIAAAGLVVLAAAHLDATVLAPVDLAQIAADASAIVHGRVEAVVSGWREDRRGIETVVTVRVAEYLKGNLGPSVSFRVPGGQMGPYRSIMPGAPGFLEGEEVVVFLSASTAGGSHLTGFSQGVYRVRTDPGGRKIVRGGPLLAGTTEERASGRASRPVTLIDLAARVRTLVEGVRR
jgi:hypothetical protein